MPVEPDKLRLIRNIIAGMKDNIRHRLLEDDPYFDADAHIEKKHDLIALCANKMYDEFEMNDELEDLERPERDWLNEWIDDEIYDD
jgi:hypothetical protein